MARSGSKYRQQETGKQRRRRAPYAYSNRTAFLFPSPNLQPVNEPVAPDAAQTIPDEAQRAAREGFKAPGAPASPDLDERDWR